MKKLFLILALVVMGITTKAQAVSDMAVIPIGVTLNSIARLTVTSGGNIEFVVNTMDQYKNGVDATTATTTTFSVASSTKFSVSLQADAPDLKPTTHTYKPAVGGAAGTPSEGGIPVEVIEYTATGTSDLEPTINARTKLTTSQALIFEKKDAGNYQGIKLAWSLAKDSDENELTKYPSDRYVVNALLQLLPNQTN